MTKSVLCTAVLCGVACAATIESAAAVEAADAVVTQGGATVTVADVDAYMARIPHDKWGGFVSSADRIESMLHNLLRTKQLAQQARELKLDQTAQASAALALARDEQLARMRLEKFSADIKPPNLDQLAKEQYQSHKDQYVIPAKVTVQHVLIGIPKHSEDDAKKLADTVRAEAVRDPAHFDALIDQYSDDASKASNHGRMEDATSSKYVAEFARAAGELSLKQPISEPVKTKFGYHILKLIDLQPGKQQTFTEVKDKIVAGLRDQYASDQRRNFLNELSNQPMDPKPDAIAALHDRYAQAADAAEAAPAAAAEGSDTTKP